MVYRCIKGATNLVSTRATLVALVGPLENTSEATVNFTQDRRLAIKAEAATPHDRN